MVFMSWIEGTVVMCVCVGVELKKVLEKCFSVETW
jgi:hypothetical protein